MTGDAPQPRAQRTDIIDRPRRRGRIAPIELGAAAIAAIVMAGLVLAEPDVLGAPFENGRTMAFTFGGTAAAAVALMLMVRHRVHPVVRVLVLGVPLVGVSWWLLSPFFIDDVVDEGFSVSIVDEAAEPEAAGVEPTPSEDLAPAPSTTAAQPVLLGAGQFVGLAGHEGTGDAGFFALPDGSHVLRLERFDIENGPDLRLYVVPGADRTDPTGDSIYLGDLKGNVGDQTYELPGGFMPTAGGWTVLVWCEAFSVEFVAATVVIG